MVKYAKVNASPERKAAVHEVGKTYLEVLRSITNDQDLIKAAEATRERTERANLEAEVERDSDC